MLHVNYKKKTDHSQVFCQVEIYLLDKRGFDNPDHMGYHSNRQ